MDGIVKEMGGLEALVSDGGENFSLGQRQLICIVRALLRDTKLLVLDEVTASIDNESDYLVQEMITKIVTNCTVLSAHRLNTILESDKILVLEDGQLAEFEAPQTLLQDEAVFQVGGNERKSFRSSES
jgi:ABC-type multidrug transport system fused ATPase/permease subunit